MRKCVFVTYTQEQEPELILTLSSLLRHNDKENLTLFISSFEDSFTDSFLLFLNMAKEKCQEIMVHHVNGIVGTDTELFAHGLSDLVRGPVDRCVYLQPGMLVTGSIGEMFNIDMQHFVVSGVFEFHLEHYNDHFVKMYKDYDIGDYKGKKAINGDYINIGSLIIELNNFRNLHRDADILPARFYSGQCGESLEDFINFLFTSVKNFAMPQKYNHLTDYEMSHCMSFLSGVNNTLDAQKCHILNFCGNSNPIKHDMNLDIHTMRLPMDIYLKNFKKVSHLMPSEVIRRVKKFANKYNTMVLPMREAIGKYKTWR